jgi:hypothetical protein
MNPLESPEEVIKTSISLCGFPERQIYSLAWDSWGECESCTKHFLPAECDTRSGRGNARLCHEPQSWRTQIHGRFSRLLMRDSPQ